MQLWSQLSGSWSKAQIRIEVEVTIYEVEIVCIRKRNVVSGRCSNCWRSAMFVVHLMVLLIELFCRQLRLW